MKFLQKSKQQGASLIGLILVVAILAGLGVLGAQAFPTFMEYQSVLKAIEKAKTGSNPAEVRMIFDKAAQIDDIKSISGKDLDVAQNNGRTTVSFAYSKEIHISGPAYLLLKYNGQTK
ncbi:MAG: DUF4845 domain-containing protein [Proteobacteria bacterium]|jgi:type II secretory pathway pseudopilin PulG|nr:DUF4845 domain-containing protein [Ramlibacter sp.]MCA0213596.1 DUF4845 domain-containing protein [Pseudomonadota bacterium]